MENKIITKSMQITGFKCNDCGHRIGQYNLTFKTVGGDNQQNESSDSAKCPECGSRNTTCQLVVKN